MKKKHTRINIEDIPEDLTELGDNIEIVINDHDPMQDDAFWKGVERFVCDDRILEPGGLMDQIRTMTDEEFEKFIEEEKKKENMR